jgi:hypothetical protein
MLPLTHHYMNECIKLVAKVRDEAVKNAVIESNNKELELEFMFMKYKSLCITLDKIHKTLIEIEGLAKEEKDNYLIINLKNDEEEQAQTN